MKALEFNEDPHARCSVRGGRDGFPSGFASSEGLRIGNPSLVLEFCNRMCYLKPEASESTVVPDGKTNLKITNLRRISR